MRLCLVVLALLVMSSSANAQKGFEWMGFGTHTCAVFAKAYQGDPKVEVYYFTWAQGFMSGMNTFLRTNSSRAHDLSGIELANQRQYVRTYCDEHPSATYGEAVVILFEKMIPDEVDKTAK